MAAESEKPIRVLIADDQERARRALKALLATCRGLEVVAEAANGNEAVQLAGHHRPDLVLMDGRMPVMDGLEATRRIKDQWPEVAVVVLSMYASLAADAKAAAADAFLLKGGAVDELMATIDAAIGRLAGRAGPGACPAREAGGLVGPDHL